MIEYNKVNVKLTNTQLRKLKTAVKSKTETTLRMSPIMLDGDNLPHELLLTKRQKTKLGITFDNNIQADLKLSKAQIFKIIQSGGFLGSLLSRLASSLVKVAVPLAKKYFTSIRNCSSCFSNWCRNSKTKHGSGITPLIISNEEMNDIMKILQALEDSNILLKRVTKTIKNKTKEQKWGFLSMLLGKLEANLLGNKLAGKEIVKASSGKKKKREMNCKSWLWK